MRIFNLRFILKLFKLSAYFFLIDFKTSASVLFYSLQSRIRVIKYQLSGHKIISLKEFTNDNNSQILFILGSGPSINEITKNQWEFIESNESWGFNNWYLHDFVPNRYFVQSEIKSRKNLNYFFIMDSLMKEIVLKKRNLYKHVKFYIRGDNVNKYKFHKSQFGETILNSKLNYCFMPELVLRSKNKIRPYKVMVKMFELGFFTKNSNIMSIPKFGNTITELISLALMNGYKKIILCGIDMNDCGHFYDKDFYLKEYELLNKLKEYSSESKTHPHMNKDQLKYTNKDVIGDLNIFSKEKFNAEIFVSSSTSSLYPEIKKYKFQ
jgi:hypothetical protein